MTRPRASAPPESSDAAVPDPRAAGDMSAVAGSVGVVFEQIVSCVARVTPEQYRDLRVPGLGGTIGTHVRHCLDHLSLLLERHDGQRLDYDHRDRGTAIELDPAAAVSAITAALDDLAVARTRPDRDVVLRVMVAGDGAAVTARSSLVRELAFVLSHTIHHAAMIRVLLEHAGAPVPEGFGLAPSTIAHERAVAAVETMPAPSGPRATTLNPGANAGAACAR